ncbi:MAG: carboxylesterase/lipase family protein [Halanaerobiales bacterium]
MLRKVEVENGIIEGLPAADPRITSFKGIPFAAPPVGENRWRAPQPAKDWDGVLKAYKFAPISMQATPGLDKDNIYSREWAVDPDIPMSEDCLYLNVWTPACSNDEKLPVYVWYFGGAFQVGNTAEMEFDGERIARRGIVVVTVNYRLNAFGFLCHPEITAEAPEAPANFGHLDQQAGTLWVKRNIAAFGGNPENITIGGQSAGGASVVSQITSPQNAGFCQKAIIESGMIATPYPDSPIPGIRRNLVEAEEEGVEFFDFLGVSSLVEARKLNAEYIRDKSLEYKGFWATVVDNKFVVGDPFELFLENKRLEVQLLLGHTSSEFFTTPDVESIDELRKMAEEVFDDHAEKFLELCMEKSENLRYVNSVSNNNLNNNNQPDSVKNDNKRGDTPGEIDLKRVLESASVSVIEYAVRLLGRINEDLDVDTPVYYYNFDAEIPGWDNPGTFHSVDLWFFFETLAKCWRPFVGKHYDLARQMCNYWSNFICSGNPNGKDSTGEEMPEWKSYTAAEPYRMEFGDKPVLKLEESDELMEFLINEYLSKGNNI